MGTTDLRNPINHSERLAAARTWAGYRSARITRQTGTLVVVVDAWEHGLGSPEDGDYRWATVCDEHSTICTHPTLRLANDHACDPLGWCEDCRNVQAVHDLAEQRKAEVAS